MDWRSGADKGYIILSFQNYEKTVVISLSALAQENRLAVFRHLVGLGPAHLSPGHIVDAFFVSATTLSFYFKELHGAVLVLLRKNKRSLFYAADYAAAAFPIDYMTKNWCRRPAPAAQERETFAS